MAAAAGCDQIFMDQARVSVLLDFSAVHVLLLFWNNSISNPCVCTDTSCKKMVLQGDLSRTVMVKV